MLDSDDDDDDDDDKDAVMDERSDGQGSGESDDESEPEYEVEEIRDHQFVKSSGKYKFLVKWLGYPSSENTWEPEVSKDGGTSAPERPLLTTTNALPGKHHSARTGRRVLGKTTTQHTKGKASGIPRKGKGQQAERRRKKWAIGVDVK